MRDYLALMLDQGVTMIGALGWQMVSPTSPSACGGLADRFPFGAPWAQMSRVAIFRPDLVEETRYSDGRHLVAPTRNVRFPARDILQNLHFKYLGVAATQVRHSEQTARRRSGDRLRRFGHRKVFGEERFLSDFLAFEARAVDTRSAVW